jgi:hypothetical protein
MTEEPTQTSETTMNIELCTKCDDVARVTDRVFKRKLSSVITGLEELVLELRVTRESLLKGGKLIFDTRGVVLELKDLAQELDAARPEEFSESFPPNNGHGA